MTVGQAPVSRLSPCPCGSGKRYKDCCGALDKGLPITRRSTYRPEGPDWQDMPEAERDRLGTLMESALEHQLAGRSGEAERRYRDVLAVAPRTHDALHMLSMLRWGAGDLAEARRLIDDALALRPPYPAIEQNLALIAGSQQAREKSALDRLCEQALPSMLDLLRACQTPRLAAATSPMIHLIGPVDGKESEDGLMLRRLARVLAPFDPALWTITIDRSSGTARDERSIQILDAATGHHPRGGVQIFVGVDFDCTGWIADAAPERTIVFAQSERPSRWHEALRAIARDGAVPIELVVESRAKADRFGSGHHVLMPPLEFDALTPHAVDSRNAHALTVGTVMQDGRIVGRSQSAPFLRAVAAKAGALRVYDPGRLRYALGDIREVECISRREVSLGTFLGALDVYLYRTREWWREGSGRDLFGAMAAGVPALCPRTSIYAEYLDDGADSLFYESDDEALDHLGALRADPQRAAAIGEAGRDKARRLFDPTAIAAGYRGLITGAQASGWRSAATRMESVDDVRAIAFFLPQFHPIPENDRWWGAGFTEWTNVARATPNFIGHDQPRIPGELGAYDLRDPPVMKRQAALAREHGLHGFCYYYYWFAGKRLLERPVEEMRATGEPDFPYCLCWANENWTRRWDGADHEILITHEPTPENDARLIRDLLPHFRDPRYLRVDGKPLFIVYRIGALPDPAATVAAWRKICLHEGIGELYLCAAQTYDTGDPSRYGFDALIEFPPHGVRTPAINERVVPINPSFRGTVVDYRQYVLDALARPAPPCRWHRTVMPGWDNTARRQDDALTFVHSTPEIYKHWLREAIAQTIRDHPPGDRLVFINAWNEWAEAAYLEPDRRYGRQYLWATRRAVLGVPTPKRSSTTTAAD